MPIEIQGIKFDTVEEVNKAYDAGIIQKNDPASSTPTTVPAFGAWGSGDTQGGVLSIPGIRPELYSALMRPHSLMAQTNGIKRSDIRTEKIGIITGQTDGSGSNPADFCSASPAVAGQLKRCVQWYNWGKVYMKTRLSALPEEGERIDYADVKKRIQNMARVNNPFVPDIMQNIDIESPAGVLLGTELFNLAIEMAPTAM